MNFSARGENGGERAEFSVGGIRGIYSDSIQPAISTGVITLGREWHAYTIDLSDLDLSNVIAGFCWITDTSQNPGGCTIYLADMEYSR